MVRVPTWEPSVSNLPGASNVPHATADTFGAQNAAALDYVGRSIASGSNQFGDVIGRIGDEQNAIDAKVKTSDYEAAYNQEEIRLKRTLEPSQMYTLPEKMKEWSDQNWQGYRNQIGGRYGAVANGNVQAFHNQKDTSHLLYVESEKDKYIPLQIQDAATKHYGIVRQGGEAAMPAAADAIAAMIREPASLNELEKRKLYLQTSLDLYNNIVQSNIEKMQRGEMSQPQVEEWNKTGLGQNQTAHGRHRIAPLRQQSSAAGVRRGGGGKPTAAQDGERHRLDADRPHRGQRPHLRIRHRRRRQRLGAVRAVRRARLYARANSGGRPATPTPRTPSHSTTRMTPACAAARCEPACLSTKRATARPPAASASAATSKPSRKTCKRSWPKTAGA